MPKLAVVSGGGTGIGRAIAEELAAEHEVVLLGRRAEVLRRTAEELSGEHRLVRAVVADLCEPDEVRRAADEITAGDRTVDVLVNNAGGNFAPQPAEDLSTLREQYLRNLGGNVLPVVLLTQALLPALRRPGGRIVTVTSIAAFRGNASYGAAKAALHPWSTELAARLAGAGITVNVVAPGYVGGTEFYRDRMTPEFHRQRSAQAPVGRGGTVADVAGLVGYLAGATAGFVTGQIIQINGGALMGRG
ncbi:SDR family NAD(P)-dependent oxidoreductase [Verrucosispora sp. WMMA2044]|uniref:SDR family oxidoreductase n=1 Tax=Verrucosispora sioxanthis TaxID=2499994 RepID=A0A6M1L789_9ACTN|nr:MULTISPECIES: SDR family oxidoreductase [Micromonospora]NEE63843.1 SDR family oxidoreductase [Verrucosispora sioxanthis]NGM12953.1 SDR family oxidoreductase [Verrucosispora sioxanthis]WBB50906.1 SDR family NAD(P)-dependent oxidoreductase [Verrucosispora sp. WMMA2044]